MKRDKITLENDLFNTIYTDPKFCNQVANAHKCCDQYSNFKHFQTCSYPVTYMVTEDQINEAKKQKQIFKNEVISNLGNKLVFVGMGSDYSERYNDDVCNHRIRTEIQNPEGRNFFIEVGTWGDELMRIDFVIDRDLESHYNKQAEKIRGEILKRGGYNKVSFSDPLHIELKKYQGQPYYWYKKTFWIDLKQKYTKQNVINLVNDLFDCNFKTMEVDLHSLTTTDFKSISPKNN